MRTQDTRFIHCSTINQKIKCHFVVLKQLIKCQDFQIRLNIKNSNDNKIQAKMSDAEPLLPETKLISPTPVIFILIGYQFSKNY